MITNIEGYLPSKVLSYVMNMHLKSRPIYLIKNGETINEVKEILGNNSELTENGKKFAENIHLFFKEEAKNQNQIFNKDVEILCSTHPSAIEMANKLNYLSNPMSLKILDEISLGNCDGMSFDEFSDKFEEELSGSFEDQLHFRYPRGENYLDLINRIEPVLFEIERSNKPIILVSFIYFSSH